MKILVIEDEKLLANSIRTLLESKSFQVEVVHDGIIGLFLPKRTDTHYRTRC